MALTPCPGCSAKLPDKARNCEHCGARPVRMPGYFMTLSALLHPLAFGTAILTILCSLVLFVFALVSTP